MKELTTIQRYALEQLHKEHKITAESLEAVFCRILDIEQVDIFISSLIDYYPSSRKKDPISIANLKIVKYDCNRLDLIAALKNLCGIPLREAKDAVDNGRPTRILAENGKHIINTLTSKFKDSLTLLIE